MQGGNDNRTIPIKKTTTKSHRVMETKFIYIYNFIDLFVWFGRVEKNFKYEKKNYI